METEGRYTLVGTLVLAVVALLSVAIVWLVGMADTIAYQTYTIYFRQQSLDGLAVGSPVKMRGIKVGVVDGYRFVPGTDDTVSVITRVDEGVPVREGAAAYIKRNLVTGIATIEIENGPVEKPPLLKAPAGERYPVIAEATSDIDKVANALSRLAVSGAQVLDKMDRLLSDENQRALSQTLANLSEVSTHLADHKQNLGAAIVGIRDASEEFRLAGASVNRVATQAETSLAALSQNADVTLDEARVTLGQLQRDTALMSERLLQFTEAGTLELTNVSRDVRTSAGTLTTAGQRLAQPRSILFGPHPEQLGPGETLP